MSSDDTVCLVCHVTFSSHEEFSMHACKQIKVEPNEASEDNKQLDQEEFKYEMNPPNFSEMENEQKAGKFKPSKKKSEKPKKKRPNIKFKKEKDEGLHYEEQLNPFDVSNLDLPEEFIIYNSYCKKFN